MFSVRSAGVIAVVVGLFGAIGTISILDGESKGLAAVELLKFFLFTCGVGGVTILYRETKADQEETARLGSSRMRFRDDVLAASHSIKLTRRMLRTVSMKVGEGIKISSADRWIKLVEQLNAAHLQVEMLRRVLQAQPRLLGQNQSDVASHLRTVDHYVRDVLLELEDAEITFEESFEVDSTGALMEFLFSPTKPTYIEAFAAIDVSMVENLND